MKITSLTKAVVATLAYSSVFEYPLSSREVYSRLVRCRKYTLSLKEIQRELRRLSICLYQKHWICFVGDEQYITNRAQRAEWSRRIRSTETPLITRVFRWVPWIVAVYVTGALAVENVDAVDDDVDLLVVTQPERLWCVRALVVIITMLMGKYRLHSRKHGGWCFNLWLTTTSLTVPVQRRSLYVAYEITQARRVLGADVLCAANPWVKEFLQFPPLCDRPTVNTALVADLGVYQVFNAICYHFQCWYMRSRRTIEQIDWEYAYFHPRNTRGHVEAVFEKKYHQYIRLIKKTL